MEIDLFIPSLKLAFEYNGHQHYITQQIFDISDDNMIKDEEKKKILTESGITLISVPYWWDETIESLVEVTSSW